MLNKESKIFEQQLTELVENSGLPVSVVYYILTNIQLKLEKIYMGAVNSEMMEQKETKDISEEDLKNADN